MAALTAALTSRATAALNTVVFAPPFRPLFSPYRYKVLYGGRGAAKSWSIARALICIAHTSKKRIGCFREYQNSIKDSVHKLLSDQISDMHLSGYFVITQNSIISRITGSEFLFKALHHNVNEIKSTEGIDIAWVEEAQLVSKESWDLIIPTIRAAGSEIWISFNPLEEDDETYTRFVKTTPPDSYVMRINYDQNPWFPAPLELERQYMLANDPDSYDHVWLGAPRKIGNAVIFKNKFLLEEFEAPPKTRFFYGLDWGFANDPLAGLRCYLTGKPPHEDLWIDYECGGVGIEIDATPEEIKKLPDIEAGWPVKADNSRPETISYVKRLSGINIVAADKWAGSVEDGITHLKAFHRIHIHPRCKETYQNFRLYSYKVDRVTREVLPLIVDANNHYPDAVRYALDGYIKRRGGNEIWKRL